jgi:hypothetical protein
MSDQIPNDITGVVVGSYKPLVNIVVTSSSNYIGELTGYRVMHSNIGMGEIEKMIMGSKEFTPGQLANGDGSVAQHISGLLEMYRVGDGVRNSAMGGRRLGSDELVQICMDNPGLDIYDTSSSLSPVRVYVPEKDGLVNSL